jgi:succinylglutamate desuccinylase
MSEELEIVNKVMDEHRNIRTHVKLVGDTVSDPEGLLKLEQARPDWMLGSPEQLSEKQTTLEQTLNYLYDGLQNHFAIEEKWLPKVLGNLVMDALMLEHVEIKSTIDGIRSSLRGSRIEDMSHEQKLSFKWTMQQRIEEMRNALEAHAGKEEVILRMVKKALESRPR